jgi:hypothetical protein
MRYVLFLLFLAKDGKSLSAPVLKKWDLNKFLMEKCWVRKKMSDL